MLYKPAPTPARAWRSKKTGGGPTMDTQASGDQLAPVAKAAESMGPVSRGYTEEIEHWAWCIRNPDPGESAACKPEVALGDAVIALTTNVAHEESGKGQRPASSSSRTSGST